MKFTYRGVDLDKLLDMPLKDLMELVDVGIVSDFGHKGPCPSSFPSWP